MMKPTYYYTLYPDTFLWINETEGVMYNAKEHTYLSFDIHGLIKKYCLMLNELRNLYTIDVSPEDWEDTDLRSWMLDTVENKMDTSAATPDLKLIPRAVLTLVIR